MAASLTANFQALRQLCQIVTQQTLRKTSLPSLSAYRGYHSSRRLWDAAEEESKEADGAQIRPARTPEGTWSSSESPLIFNGVPYERIPIAHIKASYNNTIITVTDHVSGQILVKCSCGTEGFKNAKKSTSIAGQTVGIAAATKALAKDIKMVRVLVRGIGPGRQASIKGIQMGGVDIISITDNTPVPHNGARPRKARRL